MYRLVFDLQLRHAGTCPRSVRPTVPTLVPQTPLQ